MTGSVVRRRGARVSHVNPNAWVETYRERFLSDVQAKAGFRSVAFHAAQGRDPCDVTVLATCDDTEAARRFSAGEPAKKVLPDFMAPFFTAHDAEATFHDVIFAEMSA